MWSTEPEDVVDRQIAAYNDGDVASFAAEFDDDAVVTTFDALDGDGDPIAVGTAAIEAAYGEQFAEAAPEISVVDRVSCGSYVVDHEHITNTDGGERDALCVYTVVEGLIQRLWLAYE
ncbi:nuclear transport factor 2 family protein [Halobacterium salinarum]|uniref:UCP030561 family protein n=4 Tax=Halobacterium salinarum TaxID=2242 RepID=Q9HNW4_HALSA|nr:nuclear transport factor 2 family protein [Halobacterium salinarum]AAG20106.1 hypothetical protein VNG_1917H [Halobacterium salinarum NRC-1]MBB6089119.1 hypothetical protein [Halobacterium salinarum]MDL0119548.1 nuclear transport factor 2 family protein [Halobacterium salinarum]MDL0125076.1 nuclear transport factor 2 family protein [Halobacterium salinarum]MDL0132161.1 nuclear transport factor 2 family protein [Halobacterium salinarum]